MKKIYLISSILIGLFFVSCSKEEKEVEKFEIPQNNSSNISVEETNIIGMRGESATFSLNFNEFFYNKSENEDTKNIPLILLKIGNDTLKYNYLDFNWDEFSLKRIDDNFKFKLNGKRTIRVEIPFLDRDVENEQIQIYYKNGVFLTNGPKITIQKAYEFVIVRDNETFRFQNLLPYPLGNYNSITWGFHGMCAFDGKSVIVRRGFSSQNPPIKLFNFKFGNFTPENNKIFSYEFSEQKNCPNDQILGYFNDENPVRIGLTYSNEKYYFSWHVSTDHKYKIFVSDETGTAIFKDGVVTQNFEGRIVDVEVDSKGNMYVTQMNNLSVYEENIITHLKLYNPNLAESADHFLTIGSSSEAGYINGSKDVARFNNIKEISIDGNDNVYVAEETCIRQISSTGKVSTLIGTNEAGDVEGDANNARFQGIKSIYAMKDGSIYILEENKIKILNKEHTYVKSFPIRNKLVISKILAPICVTDDGIIYFHTQNYYGYTGLGCLIPEDLVPKTMLQEYPYGMFLNKKTEDSWYYHD